MQSQCFGCACAGMSRGLNRPVNNPDFNFIEANRPVVAKQKKSKSGFVGVQWNNLFGGYGSEGQVHGERFVFLTASKKTTAEEAARAYDAGMRSLNIVPRKGFNFPTEEETASYRRGNTHTEKS